jgi:hypothetical protein
MLINHLPLLIALVIGIVLLIYYIVPIRYRNQRLTDIGWHVEKFCFIAKPGAFLGVRRQGAVDSMPLKKTTNAEGAEQYEIWIWKDASCVNRYRDCLQWLQANEIPYGIVNVNAPGRISERCEARLNSTVDISDCLVKLWKAWGIDEDSDRFSVAIMGSVDRDRYATWKQMRR